MVLRERAWMLRTALRGPGAPDDRCCCDPACAGRNRDRPRRGRGGRRGVSGSVLPRTRLAIRTRGTATGDAAHPARGGGTGGTTVPGRGRSRLQVCPVGDAGDRHAAEDAVEEAFRLAALRWTKTAGFPPEAKRVLLCAVAIRRAIDEHRRPKRVQPAGYPENVPGESPGAGHAALTRGACEYAAYGDR